VTSRQNLRWSRIAWLLPLALGGLAGCTEAIATRLDERTYLIEGPGVPGGSEGPNRREASRMCPKGYRILEEETHRGGPNRYTDQPGVYTNWRIRCL